MTREDFEAFGVYHFTPQEVEVTGARLADVKPRLMQHLEIFRREIGQPVFLCHNGLTSGQHSCQLHPLGEASDITLRNFEPHAVLKAAIESNFRGVGLYLRENRGWVAVHLDLRVDLAFWIAVKKKRDRKWTYKGMIADFKAYL